MSRILTGIQSTGIPHLGNLLSVIFPAIQLANSYDYTSFLFIADLHSLTVVKNAELLKEYTYQILATWLACGLDADRAIFYRQSDVTQTTELSWYLSCFYPYHRLKLAHSFKEKKNYLKEINTGLFTYPMLMAADILLYDAEKILVGKDQLQHMEITRDIAKRFNSKIGEVFVVPEPLINKNLMYIPGIDGNKMSKSKGNIINLFAKEKELYQQIMNIRTNNLSLDSSKNPEKDLIYTFYKFFASESQIIEMEKNYLTGGYGYRKAKQALYELLLHRFKPEREKFNEFIQKKVLLNQILSMGAERASQIATITLQRVRKALGLSIL